MDVVIQTPTEHSADFMRSLHRFLDTRAFGDDEGFTIYWAEPRGDAVLQHISFDSVELAEAFQVSWSRDAH